MIRNIILDFDGTIADTQALIVRTLQNTMVRHALPVLPADVCAKTIGLRLDESFATLFPHLTPDEAKACAASYRIIFDENKKTIRVQPFPNVIPTILQLHDLGHSIAIASSRGRESLLAYVEQMRLQRAISAIVAADDVTRVKPDPEMALKALAQIGGEPQDTIVVGDMIFDIQMGKSANMKTCAVTYGNGTPDQLASADYVIDDFKLLLSIVGQ